MKKKVITRRNTLNCLGAMILMSSFPKILTASQEEVYSTIDEIISGKDSVSSDIFFDLPEIAENGNQVKLSFEIGNPMTDDDYVKSVHIFADGNPAPKVATFVFTPSVGLCSATTRMRLAKTQDVYLLAEFSNGTYSMAQATVKVTIGGCGG